MKGADSPRRGTPGLRAVRRLSRDARYMLHLNRPREVSVLIRMMDLGPEHRLLDVGCGDGYLTGKFARRARQVVAVDPDEELLEMARSLHSWPNVEFEQGFAEKLPFADEEFDRVVAVSVVEHFRDPAQGLREMARVLRSSGVLAISVDSLLPANSPAAFREWHAQKHHVVTYFDADHIQALLSAGGLDPDGATLRGIHTSRAAGSLRRLYMRKAKWVFPLFPLFLLGCRLSDIVGLGGRMPAQILIIRARKPGNDERIDGWTRPPAR